MEDPGEAGPEYELSSGTEVKPGPGVGMALSHLHSCNLVFSPPRAPKLSAGDDCHSAVRPERIGADLTPPRGFPIAFPHSNRDVSTRSRRPDDLPGSGPDLRTRFRLNDSSGRRLPSGRRLATAIAGPGRSPTLPKEREAASRFRSCVSWVPQRGCGGDWARRLENDPIRFPLSRTGFFGLTSPAPEAALDLAEAKTIGSRTRLPVSGLIRGKDAMGLGTEGDVARRRAGPGYGSEIGSAAESISGGGAGRWPVKRAHSGGDVRGRE